MARWSSARAIDFILAWLLVLIWVACGLLLLFANALIDPIRTPLLLMALAFSALVWVGRILYRRLGLGARDDET